VCWSSKDAVSSRETERGSLPARGFADVNEPLDSAIGATNARIVRQGDHREADLPPRAKDTGPRLPRTSSAGRDV